MEDCCVLQGGEGDAPNDLCIWFREQSAVPGRATEVPLLNQAIFNDKEKTDEHEYEG